MAKYLILIYGDEREWAAMSAPQRQQLAEGHRALAAAAGAAVLDAQELEPASVATTLRTDAAGRLTTTDGPFLETKEAVGGYYLVEAGDLDEVMALAAAAVRGFRRPQRGGDPPGGGSRMSDEVVAAVAQAHRREWARVLRRHRSPDQGPRSGRGVRTGGVRAGAAELAVLGHPGSARRVADDRRAQPGPGRAAPRGGAPAGAAAARRRRVGARTRRRPRRRPPAARLHLLPPCSVPRRPGRR